jgi:hypothetical protein
MTTWRVVQEDGFPGVWSVQKVDGNGETTYPRNRWRGVSCIEAQVIVAELTAAYGEGLREGQWKVFAESLSDD